MGGMMDYEPITKGLREYIERHPTMMHAVGLTDLLDNIDAIHRSLEQENERLQEKLDNAYNSVDDSYDSGYNAGYAAGKGSSDFTSIDNWLAKREDAMTERGWIKLPVDADGVLVREGDELWSDGVRVKVKWLEYKNDKWAVFVENKVGICFYAIVEDMHHYRSDTWESIIEDAIDSVNGGPTIAALVARCKALCERTREGKE